ncbi:MAG: PepSY-like domain-containing protein [Tannerellaceae bacterium]|jgi:hypothetical protein|nr:PepSY-like domain-containing protein [Tannerellaceae bacterium]
MKTKQILSLIAGCCLAANIAAAQTNPLISTQYSNEAIAEMIRKYKSLNARDAVPSPELAARFKADFPKAYDAEWESAGGIFEVEFDRRFRDFSAYYDDKGNLLMIVEEIYRSALPAVVKNAAEARYPKYSFEDINKIRRGTETFYEIEMERRDTDVRLVINSDGTIYDEKNGAAAK